MFEKYKPAIITLSIIVLIVAGIVNYVKDLIGQPQESAPEHLQVKAPTEKILHSQKIKDEQGNDIVKYLYASETEAPAETIKIDEQEIKEDISKRTKNAQFFKKRGLHSPEGLWSQDADTQEGSTASLRSDYGADGEVAAGDDGAVAASESEKEVWVGRFYAGEPFYKDAAENKWYQTETATTTAEEFSKQTKPNFLAKLKAFFNMNALADTGSYYAGAGDGEIDGVYPGGATALLAWNKVRDPVFSLLTKYGTAASRNFYTYMDYFISYTAYVQRVFLPINTSGIASDANITNAALYFYGTTKYSMDDDGQDYIAVVQTTQASTDSLITADFWQCGTNNNPTQGGSKDLGLMASDSYNSVTLNATGISWINKGVGAWTKLGLREGHDCENAIIGTGLVNGFLAVYFSEQTGTSQDPYLEVTYTAPAAPAKFRFDGGQMKIKGKVKFE
ncbi:MAG: hypothetical protein Q8N21_05070 [bacterium]|nr:hypothetical protein [bacterium]